MKIRCDFHSHTIYGDGRNTPEEMIQAACALGLTDFGISEHGFLEHYAYSETGTFGMDETAYLRYREEMEALKEKYPSVYSDVLKVSESRKVKVHIEPA